MYKRYFLLFLLCLLVFLSHAQILVGPVAGPQLSWVSFEDKDLKNYYQVKPVLGYHAGFAMSFRVRSRFFLNTNFIYSRKGKEIDGVLDTQLKNRSIYHAFDIPIFYTIEFKGNAGANKSFKWFVGGGPNLSYWLGGKGKIQTSGLQEFDIESIDYKLLFHKKLEDLAYDEMSVENPNRLQLGINLVGGVVLEPANFNRIMIFIRWELGHSYLSKDSDGNMPLVSLDYSDPMKVRSKGVRLSVSYLFDLKTDQRKKGKSTSKIKSNRK